ncbi:uncharacterized protein NPIL_518191 [Nephila pilipes]|uniref:Uncharacterized protein n=1 Tax=Nephila pilipes TaxID=299642 RepID=A0A8X6TXK2_NEPPI|nr:uncharacterized protein NPIL_518191 [Nephila pilipes]
MHWIEQQLIVLFCVGILLPALAVGKDIENDVTGHNRYLDSLKNKPSYENEQQSIFSETSSYPELSNSLDSNKAPIYEYPSKYEEFALDENHEDKYSYGPGGFYLPSNKQNMQNYFIEEVNNKGSKQDSRLSVNGSSKDPSKKVINSLSVSEKTESEISERPTIISLIRKLFLNPTILNVIAVVAPTFIVEMIFPYLLRLFGSAVMPVVTSRIARGFARSLDGFSSLHTEQVLDVIQDYGARALEDPRCFQRFFCYGVKSYFENRSGDFWSIQKVVRKLTKTVDERLWNALGLKHLLDSMQSGHCDSLICSETLVNTKGVLPSTKFQH